MATTNNVFSKEVRKTTAQSDIQIFCETGRIDRWLKSKVGHVDRPP